MIIWRGLGWLVPLILLGSFILAQSAVNGFYGSGYYSANDWPKFVAAGLASILVAGLGYYLNYFRRGVVTNRKTGAVEKAPSHSLFFIPVEFWAILLPLMIIWFNHYMEEKDQREQAYINSPIINDKYVADFSRIFTNTDGKFKYGILKISAVQDKTISVLVSNMVYDRSSGPGQIIRKHEDNAKDYYDPKPLHFSIDQLLQMKQTGVIQSVHRN